MGLFTVVKQCLCPPFFPFLLFYGVYAFDMESTSLALLLWLLLDGVWHSAVQEAGYLDTRHDTDANINPRSFCITG